ncbi:MAG: flavodoxin family protein [Candidatus Aminicenantes bacterium]|nr:flavodoxin family protein [Candidatus Aminicenantes bacterium]
MNMTILNGASGDGRGETLRAIASTVAAKASARNWTASTFDLEAMDIKPCRGCFACWLKHPGTCVVKDDQEPILKAIAGSDLVVWLTPLFFGGYGPTLKKALDRVIPVILPFFIKVEGEVHHPQRYPRNRALLVFGTQSEPDEEAGRIFHGLVRRNALNLNGIMTESRIYPEEAAPAEWTADIAALLEKAKEAVS